MLSFLREHHICASPSARSKSWALVRRGWADGWQAGPPSPPEPSAASARGEPGGRTGLTLLGCTFSGHRHLCCRCPGVVCPGLGHVGSREGRWRGCPGQRWLPSVKEGPERGWPGNGAEPWPNWLPAAPAGQQPRPVGPLHQFCGQLRCLRLLLLPPALRGSEPSPFPPSHG